MLYKFYIRLDGKVYGPYSAKEMLELELLDDIMVTEDAMNQWLPAGQLDFQDMAKQEILERMKETLPSTPMADEENHRRQKLRERLMNAPTANLSPRNGQLNPTSSSLVHPSPKIQATPPSATQKQQGMKHMSQFPDEIKFQANSVYGVMNSQGGWLHIYRDAFVFKPHSMNFGDLSDQVYRIMDITGYKKGILTYLDIMLVDGRKLRFAVYKKQEIINELEARRIALLS